MISILRAVFIEPSLGAGGIIGRGQPKKREEVAALEMRSLLFELGAPFGVDQARGCIRKRGRASGNSDMRRRLRTGTGITAVPARAR